MAVGQVQIEDYLHEVRTLRNTRLLCKGLRSPGYPVEQHDYSGTGFSNFFHFSEDIIHQGFVPSVDSSRMPIMIVDTIDANGQFIAGRVSGTWHAENSCGAEFEKTRFSYPDSLVIDSLRFVARYQ